MLVYLALGLIFQHVGAHFGRQARKYKEKGEETNYFLMGIPLSGMVALELWCWITLLNRWIY